MKKSSIRGLTLTEMIVGAAIAAIVFLGIAAFFVSFSEGRVLSAKKIQMNTMMSRLKNSLYNETKGQSWFNMTKPAGLVTGFQMAEFPGLFYDLSVGDINAGVRNASVRVYYYHRGSVRDTRSDFTLVQHQGREVGGSIKVVATVEGSGTPGTPIPNLYVSAPPLEGSVAVIRRTDGNGEALLTGTRLGAVPVFMNTDSHNIPYYFPSGTGLPASLSRSYNVNAIGTGQVLLPVALRPKTSVTVQVRKRDGGVNSTIPVPNAAVAVQGRNLLIHANDTWYPTDADGNLEIHLVPGQWRIIVAGANLGANELRAAVDRPDSATAWTDFMTVDLTTPPQTLLFSIPTMSDVTGRLRTVNYGGGVYNFSGTGAGGTLVSATQNDWSIRYPDLAGPPSFEMYNSVVRHWWYCCGAHSREVATDGAGNFAMNQLGPVILHRDYASYPPEGAEATFAFKTRPSVPSAVTPILVQGDSTSSNRNQTRFMLIWGNGWGDYEIYPRRYDGANPRTGFTFTARPEMPLSNEGKDFYVLEGDEDNFVRIKGEVRLPLPAEGNPVFTPPSGGNPWECSVYVLVETSDGTNVLPYHAYSLVKSGGASSLTAKTHTFLSSTNPQTYDFRWVVPTLGTNRHFIRYAASRTAVQPRQFSLKARVWFNEFVDATDSVVRSYRDIEDIGTTRIEVQYRNRNGVLGTAFHKTGTFSDGEFQPPTFTENARKSEEYKSESARIVTDPRTPGAPYEVDVMLLDEEPNDMALDHYVRIIDLPSRYRAIGSWPIKLAYDSINTFSATLTLELVTSIRLFGRVYDIFGNPVTAATVRLYRAGVKDEYITWTTAAAPSNGSMPLGPCARTPCTSVPQYDIRVDIPHASDSWSWKIQVEHGAYTTVTSPVFKAWEGSPTEVPYDFPLYKKPVPGL